MAFWFFSWSWVLFVVVRALAVVGWVAFWFFPGPGFSLLWSEHFYSYTTTFITFYLKVGFNFHLMQTFNVAVCLQYCN